MPRSRAPRFDDYSDEPPLRKKKASKGGKQNRRQNSGITMMDVKPMTYAQGEVIRAFHENHLLLHGPAGTGKTFIPLFLALREVIEEGLRSPYERVVVIRSSVQSRDQGFLPGSEKEKMEPFERPYRDAVNKICQRGDAYDVLKQKGVIEFESTSFLRGTTLDNAVIIVDESQNCSLHELDTIITRVGENAKIVFCGDYIQSDLRGKDKEGFVFFLDVLKAIGEFEPVEFTYNDIVRSKLVKSYIIARDEAKAKQKQ